MRVFIEETGKYVLHKKFTLFGLLIWIQKVLTPLKAFNPIEGDDVDKDNRNNDDWDDDDGNLGIEWWHMKA